jgi:GNAT superfamily N-acetyltransferase
VERQRESDPEAAGVALRTILQPGDVDAILRFHCESYGREFGFDAAFEAHVAGPLQSFARAPSAHERIWIAERGGAIVACIAIVDAGGGTAQLRWFLVAPPLRGAGLGRRLLGRAVSFCRSAGYRRITLWTVDVLETAAHLYRSVGFERVEANPARLWGADLVEEKYELMLD